MLSHTLFDHVSLTRRSLLFSVSTQAACCAAPVAPLSSGHKQH